MKTSTIQEKGNCKLSHVINSDDELELKSFTEAFSPRRTGDAIQEKYNYLLEGWGK